MIKALIVDDVALAREGIRVMLNDEHDVEVVAEAGTGPEAVAAIRTHEPDLMFLDIQLPDLDGFEVLEQCASGRPPVVICVTAHERYAVKAFQARAAHFLLKPITDEGFHEAMQRARADLTKTGRATAIDRRLTPLSRFAVRDGDRFLLINVDDIDWFGAAGNYVELHSAARTSLVRMPISDVVDRLSAGDFARISRSTIVNLNRIAEIRPLWHGDHEVLLRDGTVLRLSRRYRHNLLPKVL
jgi:two-component system LytT family response regulator